MENVVIYKLHVFYNLIIMFVSVFQATSCFGSILPPPEGRPEGRPDDCATHEGRSIKREFPFVDVSALISHHGYKFLDTCKMAYPPYKKQYVQDALSSTTQHPLYALMEKTRNSHTALSWLALYCHERGNLLAKCREVAMRIMLSPRVAPNQNLRNFFLMIYADRQPSEQSLCVCAHRAVRSILPDFSVINANRQPQGLISYTHAYLALQAEFDNFEMSEYSALEFIKMCAGVFVDPTLGMAPNPFVQKILDAPRWADIGAIEILDEREAIDNKELITLYNDLIDLSYTSSVYRFWEAFNIKYGCTSIDWINSGELLTSTRDFFDQAMLLRDGSTVFIESSSGEQSGVIIFPLRLDLCGRVLDGPGAFWVFAPWKLIPRKYTAPSTLHSSSSLLPARGARGAARGNFAVPQTWKAHVSVYPSAARTVFESLHHILLESCQHGVGFKVNYSLPAMRSLYLFSMYSFEVSQFGKWITMYPHNDVQCNVLADSINSSLLAAIRSGEVNPATDFVPLVGDAQYGTSGGVFIRNGASQNRYVPSNDEPWLHGNVTFHGMPYYTLNADDILVVFSTLAPSRIPNVPIAHPNALCPKHVDAVNNVIARRDKVSEFNAFRIRYGLLQ
ncbi:MAG: hypothetical protein LBR89_03720 [Holosporales bacterium]|nr:hypothetical protein [Holosporales bacterium]